VLYQMDDKVVADAIRAGEIAGDIEPGDNGDVHITASQPALDAFMKTPRAAKLFSKALVTLTRAG
jgi:ABC-type molybdate transport system substrate-binding protein